MKRNCLIIFWLLCFITSNSQIRTTTNFIDFAGYKRSYEIYVPENYTIKKKYPVVFVLHGGGGQAKGLIKNTRNRFNELAQRDSFIVVYPNGVEKSWNDGARDTIGVARKLNIDDVGFFNKLTEVIETKYSIDSNMVFACGISNGGFMVQRLAFELSGKINAIGVVAANLSVVQSEKNFPKNLVPVIFINGTKDPLVPYNGGFVSVFNKKRGAILSVDESIETWKKINGCNKKVNVYNFPDISKTDGCTAIKTTWGNTENQKINVVAIKIENGGHTWPGTNQYLPRKMVGNTNYDINGCDEIWNFFQSINKN